MSDIDATERNNAEIIRLFHRSESRQSGHGK